MRFRRRRCRTAMNALVYAWMPSTATMVPNSTWPTATAWFLAWAVEVCGFQRLTFELSGRQRQDARPARTMIVGTASRAWWPAVGAPLERRVRQRIARSARRGGATALPYWKVPCEEPLDAEVGRTLNEPERAHGCDLRLPNVRVKRATTAGRQARAGENVPRTARPGLVACRWRSA